jgi:ATP phosphoribosyltransferase
MNNERLRIAIQKSGRLSEKSLQLLENCGIRVNSGGKLKAEAANFPLEVLFLRDDDIAQYVEEAVADIGILGGNTVIEKNKNVAHVRDLGFAKCRLSLAVGREVNYTDTRWFEGRKVATSYPNILGDYLKGKGVSATIEVISGSVEIAPGIGLAEGICDIVSTGSTLLANGLKEVETVLTSQAVMIASPTLNAAKQELLDSLLFRIKAVQAAAQHKYILLNAPNANLDAIVGAAAGHEKPYYFTLGRRRVEQLAQRGERRRVLGGD